MRADKVVWVEVANSQFVRIFKSKSSALASKCAIVHIKYDYAVKRIRHHLWQRSRGYCELCGDVVIEKSGHMHEMKHRGKGGEISMANSVFICPTCHRREHKDRNPKFSKKPLTSE